MKQLIRCSNPARGEVLQIPIVFESSSGSYSDISGTCMACGARIEIPATQIGNVSSPLGVPARSTDLAEFAFSIERQLAALDLRLGPGNRISQYHQILLKESANPLSTGEVSVERVRATAEAMLECTLLTQILRNLDADDAEGMRLLRELLSGAVSADTEKKPKARNSQFELFCAAMWRRAGCAVRHKEPDLEVNASGLIVPVACKRATGSGLNTLHNLVRGGGEALDQIKRVGRPGIIAIDATRLVHDGSRVAFQSGRCPDRVFRDRLDGLCPVLREWLPASSQHVVGVILWSSVIVVEGCGVNGDRCTPTGVVPPCFVTKPECCFLPHPRFASEARTMGDLWQLAVEMPPLERPGK